MKQGPMLLLVRDKGNPLNCRQLCLHPRAILKPVRPLAKLTTLRWSLPRQMQRIRSPGAMSSECFCFVLYIPTLSGSQHWAVRAFLYGWEGSALCCQDYFRE